MVDLEPRNFLRPCLLLLLKERADHGYELAARLRPMHDGDGDSTGVYRALRGLERQGLVRSEWRMSEVGPPCRTYHVTPEGLQSLDAQAHDLMALHEVLHLFLARYERTAVPGSVSSAVPQDDAVAAGSARAGSRPRSGRPSGR
jgi:PadR family transcriptional regulator PadR